MLTRIDLNSDVGEREAPEGQAADAALMPLLTSVNIACGGHAGTPDLMRRTAQRAAGHGLLIGAHPGFPDRGTMGRAERTLPASDLEALIVEQIAGLAAVIAPMGLRLSHVKPHGALYNLAARDTTAARAVIRAIQKADPALALYAPAGSVLVQLARGSGLAVLEEAFADRAYLSNGRLVSRSEPGALLVTEQAVRGRIAELIRGSVTSIDDTALPMHADTLCLHADTADALALARVIRTELAAAGVPVAPWHHDRS